MADLLADHDDMRRLRRGWTDHAAQRAAERHGIYATGAEWRDAMLSIWNTLAGEPRSAMLLSVESDGQEHWAILLCGVPVRVLYDPREACVITVLKMERRQKAVPVISTHRFQKFRGRGRTERAPERWQDGDE